MEIDWAQRNWPNFALFMSYKELCLFVSFRNGNHKELWILSCFVLLFVLMSCKHEKPSFQFHFFFNFTQHIILIFNVTWYVIALYKSKPICMLLKECSFGNGNLKDTKTLGIVLRHLNKLKELGKARIFL